MKNLRNSLVAIASITTVLVVIALGNPVVLVVWSKKSKKSRKHSDVLVVNTAANPVPVSIQNGAGSADEKVLMTLVDGVTVAPGFLFEFGPVDVSEFNTISFMASNMALSGGFPNPTVAFYFAAEPGAVSNPEAR